MLNLQQRRQEALTEFRKAVDLDPRSPVIHSAIAEWYFLQRDYERALSEARQIKDQFPDFAHVYSITAMCDIKQGAYEEALAEIERARALRPEEPLALLEMRGFVLARTGREAEARAIL